MTSATSNLTREDILSAKLAKAPSRVEFDERDQIDGQWWGADVFPLGLASFLVETASIDGDLILDPFAGVGTVGHVATLMGRRFIGFETAKERYDVASKLSSVDFVVHHSSMPDHSDMVSDVDCIVTSPPFGRRYNRKRIFDDQYFDMFAGVMACAYNACSDHAVLAIELMDWPEFEGGKDLSRDLSEILRSNWCRVGSIDFGNRDGTPISATSAETELTFWSIRPKKDSISLLNDLGSD